MFDGRTIPSARSPKPGAMIVPGWPKTSSTIAVSVVISRAEIHRESAEAQTRSLFYFGLLAVASGPKNLLTQTAADGIMEVFKAWDGQIGAGFVPPWRIVAPS